MRSTRRGSTLLVSFCNVKDRSKLVLAAVNLRVEEPPEVRWIKIKGKTPRGATGMCYWNGLVCVVHQQLGAGVPPGFVLLDPDQGFKEVGAGTLPLRSDPHAVCARDGGLYFALSGKDSIYRATLDERSGKWEEAPYWVFPGSSGEADERHLNGLDFVDGKLCVSGFGRKEGEMWPSARSGFIYNVDKGEYVAQGIYHPHSLMDDSGTLWVCESPNRRVWSGDGEEYDFPPGYIRGLAVEDECLYVGSSKSRVISKSTGRPNPQEYSGVCCVYRIDRSSGEFEVLVDFSEARNEIFELLLV
jgi:hypothetical protein